jgi:hypothetical protein
MNINQSPSNHYVVTDQSGNIVHHIYTEQPSRAASKAITLGFSGRDYYVMSHEDWEACLQERVEAAERAAGWDATP